MDPLAVARAALDRIHDEDPERVGGRAAEAIYIAQVEAWVRKLVPAPSDALLLAARCQHLERWAIARAQYPQDRAGYLRWRRAVHEHQGARAREVLAEAGVDPAIVDRVARLVAKGVPTGDAEAQALEDAACLVFLAHELEGFAAQHPDYERDKWLGILRKTWAKMSPRAHDLALTLPLAPEYRELITAAVAR